jgi:hypothetical protein
MNLHLWKGTECNKRGTSDETECNSKGTPDEGVPLLEGTTEWTVCNGEWIECTSAGAECNKRGTSDETECNSKVHLMRETFIRGYNWMNSM